MLSVYDIWPNLQTDPKFGAISFFPYNTEIIGDVKKSIVCDLYYLLFGKFEVAEVSTFTPRTGEYRVDEGRGSMSVRRIVQFRRPTVVLQI